LDAVPTRADFQKRAVATAREPCGQAGTLCTALARSTDARARAARYGVGLLFFPSCQGFIIGFAADAIFKNALHTLPRRAPMMNPSQREGRRKDSGGDLAETRESRAGERRCILTDCSDARVSTRRRTRRRAKKNNAHPRLPPRFAWRREPEGDTVSR